MNKSECLRSTKTSNPLPSRCFRRIRWKYYRLTSLWPMRCTATRELSCNADFTAHSFRTRKHRSFVSLGPPGQFPFNTVTWLYIGMIFNSGFLWHMEGAKGLSSFWRQRREIYQRGRRCQRLIFFSERRDVRVFRDQDRVSEEDDLSFYAMNERVYGYEDDVFEEVESDESSQFAL